MIEIETGGPAFPLNSTNTDAQNGMTLRDYLAAKAMHGLMGRDWSHMNADGTTLFSIWSASAYSLADAMLEARK